MRVWTLLLLPFLFSCEFFKPKEQFSEPPIAKLNNGKSLYRSDLEGLFSGKTKEDSIQFSERFVQDWIQKQLMIEEANEKTQVNEAEIERKVLDYRYALIVHSYIKNHIDKNLDTNVSDSIIRTYFEEKSDNFLLKQHIVKCVYTQLPKSTPDFKRFRRSFREYPDVNEDDFQSYISQFSVKSFLEDSTWIPFTELISGTPLENIPDQVKFLRNTTFSETSDENYVYLLKFFDYKIIEEVSPLQFVRNDIENIIINKRKIELKKQLEEKIYENAVKNDLFEIVRD